MILESYQSEVVGSAEWNLPGISGFILNLVKPEFI